LVFAAIQIMFPSPFILDGHQLVDVHRFAVNEPLVLGVDTLGEIVRLGALV
jgi:hypothetical protein